MKRGLIIAFAAAVFIGALIFKGRQTHAHSPLTGHAMGTTWTLAWRGETPPHLQRQVVDLLENWEQVMSQWRSDSDLSRFNRGEPASLELNRVIDLAKAVQEASGGAFDCEILEKVHAAGHGPPGKGIDLSGIGKGFAADRVAERLRELGVHDFIFELGGEVIVGDGDWTVDIENPVPNSKESARTLVLRNRALATSGNYHQPSHLIDPRTGSPVKRMPCSVSVTAADCATADAWATALFVLGPEFDSYPLGINVMWQE